MACGALSNIVKSSLGPVGLDKVCIPSAPMFSVDYISRPQPLVILTFVYKPLHVMAMICIARMEFILLQV
jgi:chaperonin GroEL (HSP60 family)